jgi:hypothetical protein
MVFVAGILIGLAPFLVACLTTPEKAWGRARSEFSLAKSASLWEGLATIATTYWHQVSPNFLFVNGDPSLVQSVPGHGQLYYVAGVFMLAGLVRVLLRWRDEPFGRLILVWILMAPIPASLTVLSSGHALRAATVVPAYDLLAGLGVDWLLGAAALWSALGRRVLRIGVAMSVAASATWFLHAFFVMYPVQAGPSFWEEYRPLIADVAGREKDYDLVLISPNECPQNGTLYLFYSQTDPARYFETPRRYWRGKDWESLVQFGNVYFAYYKDMPTILRQSYADRREVRVLVAERPVVPVQGELLRTIHYSNGSEAMRLYDVRVSIGPPS